MARAPTPRNKHKYVHTPFPPSFVRRDDSTCACAMAYSVTPSPPIAHQHLRKAPRVNLRPGSHAAADVMRFVLFSRENTVLQPQRILLSRCARPPTTLLFGSACGSARTPTVELVGRIRVDEVKVGWRRLRRSIACRSIPFRRSDRGENRQTGTSGPEAGLEGI